MRIFLFLFLIACFLFSGCSNNAQFEQPVEAPTIINIVTENKPQLTSTPFIEPSTTVNETIVPTELVVEVSSPLQEYSMTRLMDMISNPYHPPKSGSDDPHQGVDFSIVDPDYQIALAGEKVQSILEGKVVMVMNNRFPYGNSVMIETLFRDLPPGWVETLVEMPLPDSFGISPALTCPSGWDKAPNDKPDLALYILYAHLHEPTAVEVNQLVQSGEFLGSVGESGNALAPHLHVEMRYGYSRELNGSMAHYDVSASQEEMENYCRWRVSGWYRVVDPLMFLKDVP